MHGRGDDTPDTPDTIESGHGSATMSSGMSHTGRMGGSEFDNVPLQPMQIVSAAESQGLVRRACNNRVIVFVMGILFTIGVSTALGIALTPQQK
jgi:hypothetical protein